MRLAWVAQGFRAVVAMALLAAPPVAHAQDSPRMLSLQQAVDEALTRGERMLTDRDNLEQAALGLRVAQNVFRPKVVPNIRGSLGQTDVNDQAYRLDVSQRLVTGTEVRLGVGTATAQIPTAAGLPDLRFYNSDTTLMISQPLLRGMGRSVARRGLSSAEFRQAEAARQHVIAEQQVAVEVSAAYYRVVAQEAMMNVAQRSLERARELRAASEAKLDAGLVSQLDVLRAQQLVVQAELQLFDAQGSVEDARDQLGSLLGRTELDRSLAVETSIPSTTDTVTMERAVALAMDRRVDVRSALEGAEEASRSVAYSRNQLLPQFDVNVALTRRQTAPSFPSSFGFDGLQLATFFNVSMPIDRTPQLADYQNALIDRDRRRRDVETLRRRVADDVRRVLRSRDRAERNLAGAETNVQIASREVQVASLRYDRGLSNNLDVITAETNLLGAESRRVLMLSELAVASINLKATIGTLDPRAVSAAIDGGPTEAARAAE